MELDAKATARKQVANLLQRPDQLEKVDQIRRRISRKKVRVWEGVRVGVCGQCCLLSLEKTTRSSAGWGSGNRWCVCVCGMCVCVCERERERESR